MAQVGLICVLLKPSSSLSTISSRLRFHACSRSIGQTIRRGDRLFEARQAVRCRLAPRAVQAEARARAAPHVREALVSAIARYPQGGGSDRPER